MRPFTRVSRIAYRICVVSAGVLSFTGLVTQAHSQTAPQLLPYTAKLLAGGGTAAAANAACSRVGAIPSGHFAYDAADDGCLATEIVLSAPRSAILDSGGAVIFADNKNYTIRRIDPTTGVVATIAGGGAAAPKKGLVCSSTDANIASDAVGDGCLATSVILLSAVHLTLAPNGDILVGDSFSFYVRRVSSTLGGVAAVSISNNGAGYATAPTVTFSAPPAGGTTATGTAVINSSGMVTSVTITNSGSGYTSAPTVTFSTPGTGTSPATGTAVFAGVISTAIGDYAGSVASQRGYTAGVAGCSLSSTSTTTGCLIGFPYGFTFDHAGDLIIADYEYNSVVAANLNTTTATVVGGATITAGTEAKVMGARTAVAGVFQPCISGLNTPTTTTGAGPSGCNYGVYTSGAAATLTQLDGPSGVAVDSNNNIYVANNEDTSIGLINATTGIVTNFAGTYPLLGYGTRELNTTRGPANGTSIGSPWDVTVDPTNNVYFSDGVAGMAWRVDATTNSMYVVGGGGSPTAGSACASSGPGASLTAADAFGDGCPALQASYSFTPTVVSGSCPGTKCYSSTGLYGVFADTTGNLYLGDQGNNLIREITSGTQFGNTGATQTDYIEIHFAAGDTPRSSNPFVITAGGSIFTVGTPTCTVNKDNNPGAGNTEDCVVPVTASPTATGPYTGTLTVYSTAVAAGTPFVLTGNFVQSPITRTSVAITSNSTCGSTPYSTTNKITLTASLVANGPSNPTGTVQFYSNGTALGSPVGVTNIGTSSTPVYGATMTTTFPTAGTYNITATYLPAVGSYFVGSSSSAASFTIAVPTFGMTQVAGAQSTINPGGTALYSFNVANTLYSGTIVFSCSGLPANSTCVFSPPTVVGTSCTVSNTVALNIYTQAPTISSPAGFDGTGGGPWRMIGIVTGFVMAAWIGVFRRRIPLRSSQLLLLVALLLAATGLTACGKAAGTVLAPGTPAFNGNITVTATGSDGTIATVAVPLNVL